VSNERGLPFGTATDVLRKVLTSLVIGAVAYGITNLTNQQPIWSITLSVFIAGVVLVVQFLIDFETRVERQSDAVRALVERRFSEIHRVSELHGLIEESVLRTDVVTEFLHNATGIDLSSPLIQAFAEAEIQRVSQFLRGLNDRNVTYSGEDRDWLLTLAKNAQSGIDATSLPEVDAGARGWDDGFWESDLGNRYLEVQRAAVQRGVKIRRLFVAREEDSPAYRTFQRICRRQVDLGIDVRVLSPDEIPQTLRNVMIDFIVFDGTVSYAVNRAFSVGTNVHPAIVNTRIELSPDLVRQNADHFEELWSAGRPLGTESAPQRRGVMESST
jgi:hypothetical protein